MMSVLQFKKQQEKVLYHNRQKRQLSAWDACLQQLLISSPTPSCEFQKCRQVFDAYIQSNITRGELDSIFKVMQKSISDCLQTNDIELAKQEYETLANFAHNYLFKENPHYPWMNNSLTRNELLTHITSTFGQLVRETAWILFEKIRQHKRDKYNNNQLSVEELASYRNTTSHLLHILIKMELNIADTFISRISNHWTELCSLSSDAKNSELATELTDWINSLALMVETQTIKFQTTLHDNELSLSNPSVEHAFTQILYLSYEARTKLAIRNEQFDVADSFLKTCYALNSQSIPDPQMKKECAMLKRALNKAQQDKQQKDNLAQVLKKHEETIIPMITEQANLVAIQEESDETHTPKPAPFVQKRITHQERKKLNRIKRRELTLKLRQNQTQEQVQAINQRPRCMENPTFETLLNKISDLFNDSECEGFLFGSAIHSTQPGDFDIILPNINTKQDEDHVKQLIQLFVSDGGRLLPTRGDSGTLGLGYIKSNRHVIPMIWHGMKIDFNVFNDIYPKHAEKLDWTLVMYYDLTKKILFCIKSLNSTHDLNHKILNSITDPLTSFKTDPSRILRGARLINDQGFQFSQACLDAIAEAFAGNDNLFRNMQPYGKIYDQLSLLCHSDNPEKNAAGFARKNMETLNKLGLFFKIHDILIERRTEPKAQLFLSFLTPYYIEFKAATIKSTTIKPETMRPNLTFGLFPTQHIDDTTSNPDHNHDSRYELS